MKLAESSFHGVAIISTMTSSDQRPASPKVNSHRTGSTSTMEERIDGEIATSRSPSPIQTSTLANHASSSATQVTLSTSRSQSPLPKGKVSTNDHSVRHSRVVLNGSAKQVRLVPAVTMGAPVRPGLSKRSSSSSANLTKRGATAKVKAKKKERSASASTRQNPTDSKSYSRSPTSHSRSQSTNSARGHFVSSLSNQVASMADDGRSRESGGESMNSKKHVETGPSLKKSSPAGAHIHKPSSRVQTVQGLEMSVIKKPLPGRSHTIANLSRLNYAPEALVAPPPKSQLQASSQRHKGRSVIDATSSDFETTSEEDGSSVWSSVSDDEDDPHIGNRRSKALREEETGHIARQAALEAARQREMFRKLPSRSYSNLGQRRQSGLLTTLLNPDPSLLPYLPTTDVPSEGPWRQRNPMQNLGDHRHHPPGPVQPITTAGAL